VTNQSRVALLLEGAKPAAWLQNWSFLKRLKR